MCSFRINVQFLEDFERGLKMSFSSTPWSSVANNPILDILDLESSQAVAGCNRYQVSSPVSLSLKMPQFLIRSAIRYSVTYKEVEDGICLIVIHDAVKVLKSSGKHDCLANLVISYTS